MNLHPRVDIAGCQPHTSSVWPWSGTPRVCLYDTFSGGLHQGYTFVCCRNGNSDRRKEDNVVVVIVLAHAGYHNILIVFIVIVFIVIVVAKWLCQQLQRRWCHGPHHSCLCWQSQKSLMLLLLSSSALLLWLRGFNHNGSPPLLFLAHWQLTRSGVNVSRCPHGQVPP